MTLNQLEQFVMVAKLMNISRAAEELYVSHSSISRNISLLEDELRTCLINRDNKVTSLTKAGSLLAERAEFILQYINDTKQEVRAAGEKVSLSLKVISNSFEDPRILKIFSDFRMVRPDARISVEDVHSLDFTKKLLEKKADVIFTFSFVLPEDLPPNVGVMKLYDDEFVALVSEHSPMSSLEAVDASESGYEMPLFLNNAQFDFVYQLMDNAAFDSDDYEHQGCSSMEQLLIQIKYSGRWAILPRNIAEKSRNHCKVIPIKNSNSRFSVMMCWNKQSTNALMRPFLETVKKNFQ